MTIEILSPSTAHRDLEWRRAAYAVLPSLADDVLVDRDHVNDGIVDRPTGRQERGVTHRAARLDIPAFGIGRSLADLCDGTGLGPASTSA